jgi:hypothetical protein
VVPPSPAKVVPYVTAINTRTTNHLAVGAESLLSNPKRSQKFCCARHRYFWHQNQRISPARFEERVRIVREELQRVARM